MQNKRTTGTTLENINKKKDMMSLKSRNGKFPFFYIFNYTLVTLY